MKYEGGANLRAPLAANVYDTDEDDPKLRSLLCSYDPCGPSTVVDAPASIMGSPSSEPTLKSTETSPECSLSMARVRVPVDSISNVCEMEAPPPVKAIIAALAESSYLHPAPRSSPSGWNSAQVKPLLSFSSTVSKAAPETTSENPHAASEEHVTTYRPVACTVQPAAVLLRWGLQMGFAVL